MRGWIVKRQGKAGIRYQAKVRVPDPARPKGYRDVSETFGRQKDAEAWLARMVADLERGTLVLPETATVSDLLDLWLEGTMRPRLRPGSYRDYERYVRLHLRPGLGHLRVQAVTPVTLQAWYRRLLEAGLTPRTVQGCHIRLTGAFRAAVDWGMISSNPCDRAKPPSSAAARFSVWTPEQGAAFLCASEGRRFHAVWVLALATGMRRGELLGLRWQDVDLEQRTLTLRHQLDRSGDGWVAVPLKTAGSSRTVTLPQEAVVALRQHRIRQVERRLAIGPRWQEWDVVCATSIGTPVHPRNLHREFVTDAIAAGLPVIRFHDLRHSHASWLLQAGVPVQVVSERLGHTSVKMTLDRYAHLMPGMQEQAADVVGEVLFGAG